MSDSDDIDGGAGKEAEPGLEGPEPEAVELEASDLEISEPHVTAGDSPEVELVEVAVPPEEHVLDLADVEVEDAGFEAEEHTVVDANLADMLRRQGEEASKAEAAANLAETRAERPMLADATLPGNISYPSSADDEPTHAGSEVGAQGEHGAASQGDADDPGTQILESGQPAPSAVQPLAHNPTFSAPIPIPAGVLHFEDDSEELEVLERSPDGYDPLASGELPDVFGADNGGAEAPKLGAMELAPTVADDDSSEPRATRKLRRAGGDASSPRSAGLGNAEGADSESSGPGRQRDHWAEFEDKSGWSSVTGQSAISRHMAARKAREEGPENLEPQYSSRNTNVYGPDGKRLPESGARLVGVRGADESTEFPVSPGETWVGRDPACQITLTDGSVSRQHASVMDDDGRFVIIDNKSANGTFVNGERVARARIRSGDELEFGSAAFRFLEVGDVFKPVDAAGAPVLPRASQSAWESPAGRLGLRTMGISGGVVAVALLIAGAILWVRGSTSVADPDAVFAYCLEGVESYKKRQWDDASRLFSTVVRLDPKHQRGHRYLREIRLARSAEAELRNARASKAKGDLAEAFAVASRLTDSAYADDARSLRSDIVTEVMERTGRARSMLQAGQPEQALALIASASAVLSDNFGISVLRRSIERAAGRRLPGATHASPPSTAAVPKTPTPDPPPAPQPDTEPKSAPAAKAEVKPSARSPGRGKGASGRGSKSPPPAARTGRSGSDPSRAKAGAGTNLAKAVAEFGTGKVAAAIKMLQQAGDNREAAALRTKMVKFQEVYGAALKEHKKQKTGPAIKLLKQARGLDGKITGGKSAVGGVIRRKLADMHYVEGVRAFIARDYSEAGRRLRQAQGADPGHKLTERKLRDLTNKAKTLYDEGYVARGDGDTVTARKRWNTILKIVPPGSDLYKKTKRRLDAL